jgi:hypothetical protein
MAGSGSIMTVTYKLLSKRDPPIRSAAPGVALSVDHVGVVGADLAALANDFRALGFQTTPLAAHAGGRTGNHCVMFADSYLELIGTLPGGASATLERFLARYAGAHILAFAIDDPQAAVGRLGRAGMAGLSSYETERALDDADPASARVGFTLITPPDPAFGRLHLIRHHTRDALFAPVTRAHPNRAMALGGVTLGAPDPAALAATLSRLSGRAVVVDPDGVLRLDLPGPSVRVLAAGVAMIAGVTVLTDDANQAARAILAGHGIAFQLDGAALITRHADLIIRFEPAAERGS